MENKLICQCCGMPLDESTVSKEIDGKDFIFKRGEI